MRSQNPIPGRPIPPRPAVSLPISDSAIFLPSSIACFTPLSTRVFEHFHIFGVDDILGNLDAYHVTRAGCYNCHLAATNGRADGFLRQIRLQLGGISLHLLGLLEHLVEVHNGIFRV